MGGLFTPRGRRISSIHDKKKRRITPEPSRAGASSQPPTSGPYSPPPPHPPHLPRIAAPRGVVAVPAARAAAPVPPRRRMRMTCRHTRSSRRALDSRRRWVGRRSCHLALELRGRERSARRRCSAWTRSPIEVDTEVDTEEEDEGKPLQRRPSAMDAEDRPARPPVARGLARTHTIAQL